MSEKVALVTGATSGLGREFARQLAMRGYDLIITGRRRNEIQKVAAEIRTQYKVGVKVIIAELSRASDVAKVVSAIRKTDSLAFLVNNAGYGISKSFHTDELDNELRQLEVHVTTPLRLIHAALPNMTRRREGSIINVCSMAVFAPLPASGLHSCTKSLLHVLTETLHMEVAGCNIRVQSLCPGFTHTDFHARLGMKERLKSMGFIRWMEPEDVVRISLQRLGKSVRCVPGFWNRILLAFMSLVPRGLYFRAAGRVVQHLKR
jgi:short-subunit dehydrogenase